MPLRIAITGATGLVGSKVLPFFKDKGHLVVPITRQALLAPPCIVWDPDAGQLDPEQMEGFDVVIHLAGTNVGERWDGAYKQSILTSRVNGTRLLCTTLAKLKRKPKLLIAASAVGFYGNHMPDTILDEKSPNGSDFLADVCRQWELETKPAQDAGIRVVNTRFGVVLNKKGGALAKMWLPFQLGMGGVLGSGRQMMSWIALDEIPLVMEHLIAKEDISGAVNVVSPNAVSNKEFTKVLGRVIKRPTIFPVPAVGVKLLFGEMGQTLLLEGSRVVPKRLEQSGYQFKYADLKSALEKAVR